MWKVFQTACRIGTTLMFDLKAYGRQNVPSTGGVLLVANHQSYLDPILVAVQLRRPVSFLAKSELFENRYFGWLIRSLHAFPVRQGEGDVGAVRETIRRVQEGHVLNIYPEGSRTTDGELRPLMAGIALMVKRAEVPIVPVAIEGAFAAWPRQRKIFRASPIKIMYGPPLHLNGLKSREIVELLDRTMRGMISDLRTRS
jgi:1-acyl-sn-glycerol-3-phosphate acyltransferase